MVARLPMPLCEALHTSHREMIPQAVLEDFRSSLMNWRRLGSSMGSAPEHRGFAPAGTWGSQNPLEPSQLYWRASWADCPSWVNRVDLVMSELLRFSPDSRRSSEGSANQKNDRIRTPPCERMFSASPPNSDFPPSGRHLSPSLTPALAGVVFSNRIAIQRAVR